jgi:hypothetical protein
MSPKKLFLAHHSVLSSEIVDLAQVLRLHGLAPWVDKQGGFQVADHSPTEARRAIRKDCFGWLLYASPGAFESQFIRDVEFDEAKRIRGDDPHFLLFAVPRGITFAELRSLSLSRFGFDLSAYHSVPPIEDSDVRESAFRRIAKEVLRAYLQRISRETTVALQFSTRELLPDESDELFTVNAVDVASDVGNAQFWDRILDGLRALKAEIANSLGRPEITVNGSKHLTSAFLFGRVFARFDMRIRYSKDDYWASAGEIPTIDLFDITVANGPSNGQLFVELATLYKNVSRDVDSFMASGSQDAPAARLRLIRRDQSMRLDGPLCRAAANQIYEAIERVAAQSRVTDVHIFAAAPQPLLMMIGAKFSGLPTAHLYEWTGSSYNASATIPPGVL